MASSAALALAWLLAPAAARAEAVAVAAEPVALNADDPAQDSVGALRYRGGLVLTSRDPRFGGFSSLRVSRDGRLVAVSDEGHWLTAQLVYDGSGRLVGVRDTWLGPLIGPDDRPLNGKENHDAEALAFQADGSLIVGFEQRHRLLVYPPGARPLETRPVPLAAPADLAEAPPNGGIEALAALPGGDLLALTEEWTQDGNATGWVRRDGAWRRLSYPVDGPMRSSDAAALPSGDVVVLERGYTPERGIVEVRLRRVAGAAIRDGAVLTGRLLAALKPPLALDNFEGVDCVAGPAGEIRVYLLSDDNFSPQQRTLLLMFTLVD